MNIIRNNFQLEGELSSSNNLKLLVFYFGMANYILIEFAQVFGII